MSILNPGDWPIDPNVVDGTELAARLNRLQQALTSGFSSATRPPSVQAGGVWAQTGPGAGDITLQLFDGIADRKIGSVIGGVVKFGGATFTTGGSKPGSPSTGDLFYDTALGTLEIYDGGSWKSAHSSISQNASGAVAVSGALTVGGAATVASATVSNLTPGRVVLAGTGGGLGDSASLTFGGGTLSTTGVSVSGATTTSTLGVSASATVGTTLGVSGSATVGTTLGVSGRTTTAGLTSNGGNYQSVYIDGRCRMGHTGGNVFQILFDGGTDALIKCESNQLGLQGNSGTAPIQFRDGGGNPIAYVNNGGALVPGSDSRLKTSVTDLSYGLNDVLKLKPKQYKLNSEVSQFAEDAPVRMGLIAQDVEKIIPHVVFKNPYNEIVDCRGLDYQGLIPVLINAIIELEARVKALENK